MGCAKAILKHADVPLKNYIVVTELGIEKNKDFNLKEADIRKVKDAVTVGRGDGISLGSKATGDAKNRCG